MSAGISSGAGAPPTGGLLGAIDAASKESCLSAAVGPIQRLLGLEDDGLAGLFFSGDREREWPHATQAERRATLVEYVYSELQPW